MLRWLSLAGPFVVAALFIAALAVDSHALRIALSGVAGALATILLVLKLRTRGGASERSALPRHTMVIKWGMRAIFAVLFAVLIFIADTQWFYPVLVVAVAVLVINAFFLSGETNS